jgi:hypothetical protein
MVRVLDPGPKRLCTIAGDARLDGQLHLAESGQMIGQGLADDLIEDRRRRLRRKRIPDSERKVRTVDGDVTQDSRRDDIRGHVRCSDEAEGVVYVGFVEQGGRGHGASFQSAAR